MQDESVVQQCGGCQFRANHAGQAFGHTKCSKHRPCTGNVWWEPDNCAHCQRMEADLKVLSSNFRYAQLGKVEALLKEVKRKVEVDDPTKSWDYLPIFEFKFKKFNNFQTD